MTDNCYVYIMRQQNRLKIGISSDPKRRRKDIISASGLSTRLVYSHGYKTRPFARMIEESVHTRFALYRLEGEWFAGLNEKDVIKFIKRQSPMPVKRAKWYGRLIKWTFFAVVAYYAVVFLIDNYFGVVK